MKYINLSNLTNNLLKNCSYHIVTRLGCMFPQLRLDPDILREEFTDYQVKDSKELTQEETVDRVWGLVGKSETETRFSQLTSLMKTLLCIPHSNASSERTFSMVRKIVTENRMSMNNSTLCALLCCKINYTTPAQVHSLQGDT